MSMSTSTEVIAHHWAFAIFLIVAIGLCCLMLVGGWFLGGRARARSKNVPFESGIDSVGSARLRLSAKFYLVRIGALDWTPARSRRERMNPETNSIANRQR